MVNIPPTKRAELARRLGLHEQYVYQCLTGRKTLAAPMCPAFEAASDFEVRRWDLRPRDWHLIWPDLIGAEGAPSVPTVQREAA